MKQLLLLCLFIGLAGCSALEYTDNSEQALSSSLMSYLYPDEASRQAMKPEVPVLALPATVGLAFVPSKHWDGDLDTSAQIALMERVKASFVQYEFIDRIELIPSTYLRNGQGFDTLEQVARLHDVDLMALISYDQLQQSQTNSASLLYWTIVGMYVIPANENSVQTFVDTAVFDVKSRKMLFRAPGISKLDSRTAAVNVERALDTIGGEGFQLAMDDMVVNLDGELGRFKTRVKEEQVAQVEYKQGYSGGGGLGTSALVLLGLLAWRRRG